ncbi:MAG: glycosyltransferase family 39 protein [Anaerolineae bacterium]|jgi:4-amino-4-deoxy-L-arabinose transferase-like glycosyltransferase
MTEDQGREAEFALPRRWECVLLLLILLFAAFLRIYRLDSIPPGLTHDEADTGYFVASVYRGTPSQVEVPYGYANEPFTMYSGALFMALFGPTDLALRLHSAFFGLLMLVFSYLWIRRAFDAPMALATVALAAVSFWPVATSRFALNSPPVPALFTGAVWFAWLALFDRRPARDRWWAWLLFALLLAASLWTYEAARATALAFVALGLHLVLTDRERMRRRGLWFASALVLGLALAAPHLLDPAAWRRTATLATTLEALKVGNPGPLLAKILEALGTFTFWGDPFVTYNIPGRPIFGPPVGLLFYGGLLLCLWRWRRPAYAFVLLWIITGLLPSMIVGAWTSTLHSIALQSVVFVLPALLAVEGSRWLDRRYGRNAGFLALTAFAVLIALTGLNTFRDYFLRWGESPEVRAAYFHDLAAEFDYLDQTSYSGVVALSSPHPDLPLDPLIADLRIRREDLTLRWFDGRRALLFPVTEQSLLILPSSAPLASRLSAWVPSPSGERIMTHPEDTDSYFDVFLWYPDQRWEEVVAQLPGEAAQGTERLPLPVNFGDAVDLVGYDLKSSVVAAGETLSLVTAWRVRTPAALGPIPSEDYGRTAAIFVHLLDAAGNVVAQEDRLDVPAWDWRPGEGFLQIHQLALPTALSPGTHALEIGVYTRPDLERLRASDENGPTGDRALIQSVEVTAP